MGILVFLGTDFFLLKFDGVYSRRNFFVAFDLNG